MLMKPMLTRVGLQKLRKVGCVFIRNNGRHDNYRCPCGEHTAPVPTTHKEVSPGTIRDIIEELPCPPKGWLQ